MTSKIEPNKSELYTTVAWDYDDMRASIPAFIHRAVDEFNELEFEDLLQNATKHLRHDAQSGLEYLHLNTRSSSEDEVVVHFNPFMLSFDANMLLRARFLASCISASEIRDDTGKRLSLIGFASPNGDRTLKLSRRERRTSARGDFSLLARNYIGVISRLGYKKLRIVGYSQGATIAAAVAAEALRSGLGVSHVALGEPANVMRRGPLRLGRDFSAANRLLNKAIDDGGLEHMKRFHFSYRPALGLIWAFRKSPRKNISVIRGLGKDGLKKDLRILASSPASLTVSYGSLNRVCPKKVIEKIFLSARSDPEAHSLHSVEIKGAHHVWGDRLDLLAYFYYYALTR